METSETSEPAIIHTSKWNFYNVILLGVSFMFVFTAFQTSSMIEQTVLEGANNGTFHGSGYTSLCIIYGVLAASNWIAPSVVAVLGAKICMIVGGITYTIFVLSFLKPMIWSLYSCSVIIGIGAALIWTGQGNFLTVNSNENTMARNSGIFWALLQCSMFFGNLFIYFAFQGETTVDDQTRKVVYIVLTSVCGFGVLLMFLLNTKVTTGLHVSVNTGTDGKKEGPVHALVSSFKLFTTREMAFLAIVFAYTGLELTFFSGVYGTSVGHTDHFHNTKSLQGLTGIFIGVGEVLGGLIFGIFGNATNKYGRDPVVLLGFIVHTVCFYLIFLNLPEDSPLWETSGATFVPSNKYIALLCAFLLGLGDSSYNTQIYSILGHCYRENSAPAFAMYKFVQSLAAAAAFFYTQQSVGLLLQYHLLILVVFNTMAALSFFLVEHWVSRRKLVGYELVPEQDSDVTT